MGPGPGLAWPGLVGRNSSSSSRRRRQDSQDRQVNVVSCHHLVASSTTIHFPLRSRARTLLKMLQIYKEVDLAIPENVEVIIDSRVVTVKGPRGQLTKVGSVGRSMADSVAQKRIRKAVGKVVGGGPTGNRGAWSLALLQQGAKGATAQQADGPKCCGHTQHSHRPDRPLGPGSPAAGRRVEGRCLSEPKRGQPLAMLRNGCRHVLLHPAFFALGSWHARHSQEAAPIVRRAAC